MAIQDFVAGQVLTAAQMDALQANDYNQTVSNKTASYTLVAADKGTRVVMSNAGATTITVNTSLFAAGDTLFIQNIGAGTCTITAGTATVTTAGSLALAQWGGGVLYFTSASAAIFFPAAAAASKVVQIVTATTNTSTTNTTTTYADTTLTATITPTSASNKVLVFVSQNGAGKGRDTGGNANLWWQGRILRGATEITLFEQGGGYNNAATTNYFATASATYLDSPATTSATTYKTQFRINTAVGDGVGVQFQNSVSFITLMEVTP